MRKPPGGTRGCRWGLTPIIATMAVLGASRPAAAIPAFARRYNLPCEQCHSMMPRLTRLGYSFYKGGYRFAAEGLKVHVPALMMSVLADVHIGETDRTGTSRLILDTAELQQVGLIDSHLTARVDYLVSSSSDADLDFREAFVRYNSRPLGDFYTVQVGQIPLLTGFKLAGAREATITPSMWFGPTGPLTRQGQGNIALGDLGRGAELGYNNGGFNGRVSLFGGINEAGERTFGSSGRRLNDWLVQAEYCVDRVGTSVAGFHYSGKTALPSVGFDDTFTRSGLFVSWTRELKEGEHGVSELSVDLNGAYFWGRDRHFAGPGTSASSSGSIIEVSLYRKNRSAFIARYDSMKPSGEMGTTSAFTFAVAHRPSRLYRCELEYRKQMRPGESSVIGSVWVFY